MIGTLSLSLSLSLSRSLSVCLFLSSISVDACMSVRLPSSTLLHTLTSQTRVLQCLQPRTYDELMHKHVLAFWLGANTTQDSTRAPIQ